LLSHVLRGPRRALLLAGVSGIAVLGAAGIAFAGSGSASQAAPTSATITASIVHGKLKYVASNTTIASGGTLTVRNGTNFGHTLSLVRQSLVPSTKRQRQKCFTPNHICFAVAKWHGVNPNGNGPPTINPATAGRPGWDTEGGLHKKGDSIFYSRRGPAPQVVSAPAGTTLHFMCVIHPWMHGTITVK
jgi:plastocyanin